MSFYLPIVIGGLRDPFPSFWIVFSSWTTVKQLKIYFFFSLTQNVNTVFVVDFEWKFVNIEKYTSSNYGKTGGNRTF